MDPVEGLVPHESLQRLDTQGELPGSEEPFSAKGSVAKTLEVLGSRVLGPVKGAD